MRKLSRFAAAAALAAAALGASAQGAVDYDLDLVDPEDGATIFSNTGEVPVRATVTPALANGDSIELLVDGLPAGAPRGSLEFPLSGIERGQHLLQARIIDSTGNVGSISPSKTIYVWEASLLFPNRRGGGS